MRSQPFHNVKDVKKLAEKAFSEVTEEFVWNCYNHVEKQELYYKKLMNIDPLPAENIDSWEINDVVDYGSNLPENHFLSLLQSPQESPVNSDQPFAFSNDEPEEIPYYKCSRSGCNFQNSSLKVFRNHLKTHYDCNLCDKTFSGNQGKRNYDRHVERHRRKSSKKPKSFQCDKCEKAFLYHSYLKRHIEKSHKNNEITAELWENVNETSQHNEIGNTDQECNKRKQKLVARKLF